MGEVRRRDTGADIAALIAEAPTDPGGVSFEIMRVAHAVQVQNDAIFKAKVGITVRQFVAMVELIRNPGIGSGQLARRLLITPQSAGPLLTRLEALGLVKRDRTVGLRMRVDLTEHALATFRIGAEVIKEIMDADRARLSPDKATALEELLREFSSTLIKED